MSEYGFKRVDQDPESVCSRRWLRSLYLDPTRRFLARLSYHRLRSRATGADIHKIIIAFTAVFPQGSLSCANSQLAFRAPSRKEK